MKSAKLKLVSISKLMDSGRNDLIYRPVNAEDPEIQNLARSIMDLGLIEPMVISKDGFIIAGHRRKLACELAGLEKVDCVVRPISFNHPDFMKLLREANRQRVKGFEETCREAVADATDRPEHIRSNLLDEIAERSRVPVAAMDIIGTKSRAEIKGNRPLLDAAIKIIDELEDFWPISDRAIHYQLLNDPPLKHRSKAGSIYRNDKNSYNTLTGVLTRGRLSGEIPWEAIGDETRPMVVWNVQKNVAPFIKNQLDRFMKGYNRDYMQSQPNHIEIVGEKLTIKSIIDPVAMKYCIPYTIGRGYSSINPRHEMAERFRESGKSKLIILILSDLDPDGVEIAQSFARSMRDDFGLEVHAVKVALTKEQITELNLSRSYMKAKKGSKNYEKFKKDYGEYVYELEALTHQKLEELLTETIESIVAIDAFNHELKEEQKEKIHLGEYRERALKSLGPQP
jgi:ParB-like chromosome segregation protein Spo0J